MNMNPVSIAALISGVLAQALFECDWLCSGNIMSSTSLHTLSKIPPSFSDEPRSPLSKRQPANATDYESISTAPNKYTVAVGGTLRDGIGLFTAAIPILCITT